MDFWAVLGPLGPNPGKPDFSGKIRLGQLSLNIVPQLQAKNQENRWSRFPEIFDLPPFLGHFGLFWAVLALPRPSWLFGEGGIQKSGDLTLWPCWLWKYGQWVGGDGSW